MVAGLVHVGKYAEYGIQAVGAFGVLIAGRIIMARAAKARAKAAEAGTAQPVQAVD
jgi:hypothetical protein